MKRQVNTNTGQLEYLAKWEDRLNAHNQWLSAAQLRTAKELRTTYNTQSPLTEQEIRAQQRIEQLTCPAFAAHTPYHIACFDRTLQGAKYITVVNGLSFYYQFNVRQKDRYKFTVNTHRGPCIPAPFDRRVRKLCLGRDLVFPADQSL